MTDMRMAEDLLGSPIKLALHEADLKSFSRAPIDWRIRVMDQLKNNPTVLCSAMEKLDARSIEQVISDELDLALRQHEQAQRWVQPIRAAAEEVPVSDVPAVTPDTVWSGDLQTLIDLFHVSLYRVNVQAAWFGSGQPRCGGSLLTRHTLVQPARRNGRTHEQP